MVRRLTRCAIESDLSSMSSARFSMLVIKHLARRIANWRYALHGMDVPEARYIFADLRRNTKLSGPICEFN